MPSSGEQQQRSVVAPRAMSRHFGTGTNSTARRTVAALVDAAKELDDDRRDHWQQLFSRLFGPHSGADGGWADELSGLYGVDDVNGPTVLFAVHTYYAFVVKAVAARVVGLIGELEEPDVRQTCQRLESTDSWREHGVANFVDADLFNWYLQAWTPQVADALADILQRIGQLEVEPAPTPVDIFRRLYQNLLPRQVRHDLGEYYTPRWLAELTLERVDYDGQPARRLLDPACGSGTFLMAAMRRIHRRSTDRKDFGQTALANIAGLDLNPLAALAARANIVCAVADTIAAGDPVDIPVYCCNALPPAGTVNLFAPDDTRPSLAPFDVIAGNPPWIHWEHLPEEVRRETKPLWQRYGLFSLSGSAGRLGGGKKDLSMLFTYACCDEYLCDGGRLSFVITASVFKSKGAGDGFRRFRYDDDNETTHLAPVSVDDFTEMQPFPGATTKTAVLCLEKSANPVSYPVPYRVWSRNDGPVDTDITVSEAHRLLDCVERAARPVDGDTSPWLTAPLRALSGIAKVVGDSDYTAYEGVNSGGLNGCYWVCELERGDETTLVENLNDVGRIQVDKLEHRIENDRLSPLLRSGDLQRWQASPQCSIVLGQNPETRSGVPEPTMKRQFPNTYRYFQHFEGDAEDPRRGTLRGRSLFRRYYEPSDPFYSMYGVGPYTMAPWKVCWQRIDTRLRAAVVGPDDDDRVVLPQETITFVPLDDPDEAHFFCALFNSAPADALVRCYSTGKGFASAHILDTVAIPGFDDSEQHRRLAELSRRCHRAVGDGDDAALERSQRRIDAIAADVWGISDEELTAIYDT